MKFICNKEELIKGINIVMRAAYGKYQKSILECIHIKTVDQSLVLDAFDMTTAMKTTVYAQVEQPGETAIPARILYDIVNKFPSGELIFEREEASIRISGANSSAVLSEMDAQQFPAFPEMDAAEDKKITIKQKTFKEMIDKTAFSAYTAEDRPIFTGLLIETDPDAGTLSVVGIDGIRMAKKVTPISTKAKIKAVVPSKMLKEASRIMNEEDGDVTLCFNENACYLSSESVEIFTRLLDGEFINYRAIIPMQYKTRVRVNTGLFERSLELMMVLAREDSSNLIRMSIENSYIDLQSKSEYGETQDKLTVDMQGDMLRIAFNAKFLLDVFKVVEDEEVYMEFTGRLQPCVIKPVSGDEFLYLVVPVNVAE